MKEITNKQDLNLSEDQNNQKIIAKTNYVEKLFYPLIIVLFTAIVGSGVGYIIQDWQFKKTTLFKAKFDLILESRKDVTNLLIDFEKVFKQIQTNENFIIDELKKNKGDKDFISYYCKDGQFNNQILALQNIKFRLDYVDKSSMGLVSISSSNEISKSISNFQKDLGEYINCLQAKQENCESSCSDNKKSLLTDFEKIIDVFTDELHSYVK